MFAQLKDKKCKNSTRTISCKQGKAHALLDFCLDYVKEAMAETCTWSRLMTKINDYALIQVSCQMYIKLQKFKCFLSLQIGTDFQLLFTLGLTCKAKQGLPNLTMYQTGGLM